MKRPRFFGMIRHACLMVGRTIRSYALLSVTVVLSFSLLLGYLLYTDASLYNRYKQILSHRWGDVILHDSMDSNARLQNVLDNIEDMGQSRYYIAFEGSGGRLQAAFEADGETDTGTVSVTLGNWYLLYYPDHAWPTSLITDMMPTGEIVWLDGRTDDLIYLDTYDAVISEGLFYAMGFDQMEDPQYTFVFENGMEMTLHIVGYSKDKYPYTIDPQTGAESEHLRNVLILSTKLIDAENLWSNEYALTGRYTVIYSEAPEQVVQLADSIGYNNGSVYEQQNEALAAIRSEKSNKAIIACALLLLLGINLYSSFTNALNDRKFEIGVKRAIGASSWSIVRQFLYESIIVMVANTLISIALVADVFIVYKYIYERIPDTYGNYHTWTIYISPHSIAMFGLCAVTLTVVFSLIFAYKSTRVEIVQYLKAE